MLYKTLIGIYWFWHAYRFQICCMRPECLHENLISLFIPHSKWWQFYVFDKKAMLFTMNSQFSRDGSMFLALPLQIPLGFRNFLNTNADSSMFLYANSKNSMSCRNFYASRKSATSCIITNGRKTIFYIKLYLEWIDFGTPTVSNFFACIMNDCMKIDFVVHPTFQMVTVLCFWQNSNAFS